MLVNFKGFPTEISEYIELPDIAELMMMPFFSRLSIDDVYKYGTDFQRHLISKTPLKNNTKNILVYFYVQLLQPGDAAVRNVFGSYGNEWHVDGAGVHQPEYTHLLQSKCDATTEFNTNPFSYVFNKGISNGPVIEMINKNVENLNLTPKKIESNKVCSFTTLHIHRAPYPQRPEFRFTWRMIETNVYEPNVYEEANTKFSKVCDNTISRLNIEKQENGIFVYTK